MKISKISIGILCISIISALIIFSSCESNDIKAGKREITPPDFSKSSGLEYYYPDSGGIATQLILKGYNLGSDTSYLKVTVNGKNAKVIGANEGFVHAVVPARADTGLVKLYVGKDDDIREFTGDNEFKYFFKRNVTTVAGLYDKPYENGKPAIDGSYQDARFRRPWRIASDKEGALYVIDEGRGTDKNGALRKVFQGQVETIVTNTSGPFQSPTDLAFSPNEDTLYVANWSGGGVQTHAAVIYATRNAGFVNMKNLVIAEGIKTTAVAVHPKTGELFFNSEVDGYIYKYDKKAPNERVKMHQVNNATGTQLKMVFNNEGTELIITVKNRHVIYKAKYDSATKTIEEPVFWVGQWNESGYVNGKGSEAKFDNPVCAVFDEDGNLFVAERHLHGIRKITPSGETSLWAGTPGEWGHKDGLPDVAKFRDPEGITLLPDGSMYVVEMGGHVLRRIVVE